MSRSLIAAFVVAITVILALVVVAVDRGRGGGAHDAEIARLRADEDAASSFIYRVTDAENDVGVADSAYAEATSDAVAVALKRDRRSSTERAAIASDAAAEATYRSRMRAAAAASQTAMAHLVTIVSERYGTAATSTLRLDAARLTSARRAAVTAADPAVPDARTAQPMRAYLEAVPPADASAAILGRRVDRDVAALHDRMERDYRARQKAYSDALVRG